MANFISESFILQDKETDNSFEMFINNKGEIFLQDLTEDIPNPFFITICKEDWDAMKKFIDGQFESFKK